MKGFQSIKKILNSQYQRSFWRHLEFHCQPNSRANMPDKQKLKVVIVAVVVVVVHKILATWIYILFL